MEARRLARWAARAAIIGGLAFGAIYGAHAVSATDSSTPPAPQPAVTESSTPVGGTGNTGVKPGTTDGGTGNVATTDGAEWG